MIHTTLPMNDFDGFLPSFSQKPNVRSQSDLANAANNSPMLASTASHSDTVSSTSESIALKFSV